MPLEPSPHSRIFIPLLVAVIGIAIGVGVVFALQPLAGVARPRPAGLSAADADKPAIWSVVRARPLSDRAIYARVEPSVVDVTSTLRSAGETASGTGFVINARAALVLTNNHVVRGANTVTVTLPGTGRTYQAQVVGTDPAVDIAVLRIRPVRGLAAAPLGDPATVPIGAAVVAIGNRAGAGGTPAAAPGVLSGTSQSVQASDSASTFTETLHGLLATTARIEPGDSGGPLADADGTVIGVDTAAGTGDDAAAGYAIPIDTAMAAARQIIARARRGR